MIGRVVKRETKFVILLRPEKDSGDVRLTLKDFLLSCIYLSMYSFSLSFSLCLSLPVSLCLCLSVSLSLSVSVSLFLCVCVFMCDVHAIMHIMWLWRSGGGHWIPWNWSYGWLWTTVWVLGTEPSLL